MLRKIWSFFNNAIAGAGTFLLLLFLEFFAWLRAPTQLIPAWFFYVSQLVMIIIICVIYACLRYRYDIGRFSKSIQVRQIVCIPDGWILIVKDTPLLEINRVVSVCFQSKDNDYEQTIATGYVETKNNRDNLQIKVPKIWSLVADDLKNFGHKLIKVKPVIDITSLS